jgi:hypothetical protein
LESALRKVLLASSTESVGFTVKRFRVQRLKNNENPERGTLNLITLPIPIGTGRNTCSISRIYSLWRIKILV